jgi:hypothetical protein
MSLTSKLPHEILLQIYQFNPEHREKMQCVLQDIRDIQYCDACGKMIIKYIYSRRRCDKICCSMECVDNY